MLDFLFGYVAYLLNTCLAFENSERAILQQQQQQLQQSQSQQLTGFAAALLTQKWIFTPKESDIWRQLHCELVF